MRKLTYSYIRNYINSTEEELVSKEYRGNKIKLEIRCKKCKNIYWISFNQFQKGYRHSKCSNKKKGKRHTHIYVKQYFEKHNWKVLSKNYENNRTKMKVRCEKGHIVWMSFAPFKKGQRCGVCYRENNKKENHPMWKGGVKKKDIPLFNTYAPQINWIEEVRRDPENKKVLQIKCANLDCREWFNPIGQEVRSRIKAINGKGSGECRFYCSEKCKQNCSVYRQRYYFKGFRKYKRNSSLQKEWSELVKERDGYQCIKCGRSDLPLIAHHIEGLNVNPLESADVDLGITLCKKCDKEVHSEIGCRRIDLTMEYLCKKE